MSRAARTRFQMVSRPRPRFSQPKAVSSPARSRIVWASGSCITRPLLPRAVRESMPSISRLPSCSPSSSPPSTPANPAINVLLPAPDAPSSSTRSPGLISKSTCRNAKSLREACLHPQSTAFTPAATTVPTSSVVIYRFSNPRYPRPYEEGLRRTRHVRRKPSPVLSATALRPVPAYVRIRSGQARRSSPKRTAPPT